MATLKDVVRTKFPFGSKIRFRSDNNDQVMSEDTEPKDETADAPVEEAPAEESAPVADAPVEEASAESESA